jgi:lipopolysaccharide/colanic/teichoic acid biosynthesis glycosyltransferase
MTIMQHTPYLETNTEAALTQPKIYHAGKRAIDITLSLVALVLLSPVCALVAALIKLDSDGPVFFRQTRLGLGGKPFTFYKFRTMQHNCDNNVHQNYVQALIRNEVGDDASSTPGGGYKLAQDRRITRVGAILRKTSLDEIPQLFNVLKGEMSLVGPRPPLPYEVEVYQDWHKKRLDVIPGITGLWQVQGRSRVSFDEMVRMDLDYAAQSSLWLDLKIIVLTIPAVLTGSGAR